MSNYETWLIVKLVLAFIGAIIYGFIRGSRQIRQEQREAED